ncbi:hypothetical protein HDV02_000977 [Globomyces sp. JEL0801]|nr:hypothetical protein HDV02_000977 [Globomyces sp. JEL0801]
MALFNMRVNYTLGKLLEAEAPSCPFSLFDAWFMEHGQNVKDSDLVEKNAVCLATADRNARPSNRIVLLKQYDKQGFVFFTNYQSRKATDLLENPFAAMTFYWGQRSVRVEGKVVKVPEQESDEYFLSRPIGSQLGAWTSPQSQPVASREVLDEFEAKTKERFQNEELKRPPFWGGYRLVPDTIEFWQGRPSRLHDRLLYKLNGTEWTITRLAP